MAAGAGEAAGLGLLRRVPLGEEVAPARRRAHPVARFVAVRLAQAVLTLLAVSVVIFLAMAVLPGSPASAVLGKSASPHAVAVIDHRLGYDHPLVQQYGSWLWGMLHGSFGNSAVGIAQGDASAPIWGLIRFPLANSATLALLTAALLIPLSLVLGVWSGIRAGKAADHVIATTSLVLMAMPEFVVGALLIVVFFVVLHALPAVSLLSPGQVALFHPRILVLPVLTLLSVSVAWTVRLVRVGTIEVARSDHVLTARLAGISEWRIRRRYVLRNALAPSVQIFALSIQYLFGGVIVTEMVFGYPGIGVQLVNAVTGHDNPQVQAIAMVLAAIYVLINVLADLVVILLVPKLRHPA